MNDTAHGWDVTWVTGVWSMNLDTRLVGRLM